MADLDTKLRDVDRVTPPDMWSDIGTRLRGLPEGGSQLPTPPTAPGQRVVAGVVALAVFAVAAVFAVRAFDGDDAPIAEPLPPGAVTFTFEANELTDEGLPIATMNVGDRAIEGRVASSYTWKEDGGISIFDVVTPSDLDDVGTVPAGAPIVVDGNAQVVRGWVDSCCDESFPPPHLYELDLSAGASMPAEGSRYVLEFRAEWAEGAVTFLWPIEIVHRGDANQLVISVEDVEGGSVAYPPVLRARYGDASIRLEPIAVTPNGELTYPTATLPIDVPVGTPIAFENAMGDRLRVWRLESAGPGEMVDHAAEHHGALEIFDGPGKVAISIEYSNDQAWTEFGLIVHVAGRSTPEDLPLAEGAAGNGTWTLTTFGGAEPKGVQLLWRGYDDGVLSKRVAWHDDAVTVGTVSAADRGDPDDEVVFGVAPSSAVSVTHVPGQGLPDTTVDAIDVPGVPFTAFVLTSYAGIGVVSALDADPEDGRGVWRTLIVPEGATELLRTVEAFLQARIDGEGAERFLLDDQGATRFTPYAAPSDDPEGGATSPLYDAFGHAVVLFIEPPTEQDATGTVGSEVGILIEGAHGASYETLSVVRQPDSRFVISLLRPGIEGP